MPNMFNVKSTSLELRLAFCIWLVSLLYTSPAVGQTVSERGSLNGHQGVLLVINIPRSEPVHRLGVRRTSLEQFVLRRLKKEGIEASTKFTGQTLVLELRVDVFKVIESGDTTVYSFVSDLEASQVARLVALDKMGLAVTWSSTKFGIVTRSQPHVLRDAVEQTVKNFLNDWNAARAPSADIAITQLDD